MSEALEVGDLRVEPGERGAGWIRGVELTTTNRVDVPVLGINGARDGPTVLLFSLQHGTEFQNLGVVHKLCREELTPESVRGQVIGIPVANPLSYMHATYRSWLDNKDVGYVSVENPRGGPSDRLAHALWEEAWSQSDLVLDMHANHRSDSLPCQLFEAADGVLEAQERMASAFGVTTIRFDEGVGSGAGTSPIVGERPATLRNKAIQSGIPCVTTELVDGRWISEPSQSIGVQGILNLMREFDLLDGEARPGHEIQEELGIDVVPCKYTGGSGVHRPIGMIRSDHGGVLIPKARPGEFLEAGDPIAEVVDLHGEPLEEVTMPRDGSIWAYPCSQFFETGGVQQTIEEGGMVAFGFAHHDEA